MARSSAPSDLDVADLARAALAMAKRFAHGGTLWTWAPGAPEHAQHVAVEFVHPVIMGARSLPAVAVVNADAQATLRAMARPGDVLLVVDVGGAAPAPVIRRAEAWGLTTILMGAGPPSLPGLAHHHIWCGDEPAARHDGRLVLGYHVLWELTHVCFEHPGLLEAEATDEVCITCSDEGRLAEVASVHNDVATVRTAAGVEQISTLMVGTVRPGDLVLVHAGTAITVVDG